MPYANIRVAGKLTRKQKDKIAKGVTKVIAKEAKKPENSILIFIDEDKRENIASGEFSPLKGFMGREDYDDVLDHMRLSSDLPWTIPIVLDADGKSAAKLGGEGEIILAHSGRPIALMEVEESFPVDRERHARVIYGTDDPRHPGVAKTLSMRDVLLAGVTASGGDADVGGGYGSWDYFRESAVVDFDFVYGAHKSVGSFGVQVCVPRGGCRADAKRYGAVGGEGLVVTGGGDAEAV